MNTGIKKETPTQTLEAVARDHADQWHMRKLPNGEHNPVWACEVRAHLAGAAHQKALDEKIIERLQDENSQLENDVAARVEDHHDNMKMWERGEAELTDLRAKLADHEKEIIVSSNVSNGNNNLHQEIASLRSKLEIAVKRIEMLKKQFQFAPRDGLDPLNLYSQCGHILHEIAEGKKGV